MQRSRESSWSTAQVKCWVLRATRNNVFVNNTIRSGDFRRAHEARHWKLACLSTIITHPTARTLGSGSMNDVNRANHTEVSCHRSFHLFGPSYAKSVADLTTNDAPVENIRLSTRSHSEAKICLVMTTCCVNLTLLRKQASAQLS